MTLEELKARRNELYRAMVVVEWLGGASPEQTAVILELMKRDRELRESITALGGDGMDVGEVHD